MKKNQKANSFKKRITIIFIMFLLIWISEVKSKGTLEGIIGDIFLLDFNGNFERTLLGDITFNAGSHERLYHVKYITNENSYEYKWVSLSDLVEVSSWHEIKSDRVTIRNFEDSNHTYELFDNSDGVYFICRKKGNKAKTNNLLK